MCANVGLALDGKDVVALREESEGWMREEGWNHNEPAVGNQIPRLPLASSSVSHSLSILVSVFFFLRLLTSPLSIP